MTRKPPKRPGLVKARSEPFISRRSVPLVKSSDYRFRELFENADVMSEGKAKDEPDGATYYGSTSIVLPFVSKGGAVPDDEAEQLLALLATDPHARVRAIRIACLEAQVRARAPIGRVRAELFVRRDRHGLRVDVEVEARVFEEPGEKPAAPPRSQRGGSQRS
jgi:hypothetical protein